MLEYIWCVLCREVVLFRRLFSTKRVLYARVQMVCPLLGGLSSFGVSFIRGFTVGIIIRDILGALTDQNELVCQGIYLLNVHNYV